MLELGPHAPFIVWAYIGVAAGIVALIAYAVLDAHRVKARLRALDERGLGRRPQDDQS